jgi:hypothetical protein
MKTRFVAPVIGAFLLAGAGSSLSETAPSPPVTPVSVSNHDEYLKSAKRRMIGWRAKIGDLGVRASNATTAAGKDAVTQVSAAWARTKLAANRLGAVGEAGWEDARAAYERAGERLEAAWARLKPAKT